MRLIPSQDINTKQDNKPANYPLLLILSSGFSFALILVLIEVVGNGFDTRSDSDDTFIVTRHAVPVRCEIRRTKGIKLTSHAAHYSKISTI